MIVVVVEVPYSSIMFICWGSCCDDDALIYVYGWIDGKQVISVPMDGIHVTYVYQISIVQVVIFYHHVALEVKVMLVAMSLRIGMSLFVIILCYRRFCFWSITRCCSSAVVDFFVSIPGVGLVWPT
jgi:hypothetical protein